MMNRYIIPTVAALCAMLCSCSVKEDRSGCPTWLQLTINDCRQYSKDLSILLFENNDNCVFEESVAVDDYPDYYEREIPKGYYKLVSYTGIRRCRVEGDMMLIPHGEDADSLYAYNNNLICQDEFTRDSVMLQKRYATVFLKVNMLGEEVCPYDYAVYSSVNGTYLSTFAPVHGSFYKALALDESYQANFTLPRQDDNRPEDLYILATDRDSKLTHVIPLGSSIDETGYSWNSRDLEDIYLTIDYVECTFEIKVADWEAGNEFDMMF